MASSDSIFDLAIAGAGVMGLSCAWEAARRGRSVLVFDPQETSAQASWAAAGILVTRDAHAFHSSFREFYVRSIRMYPEWLEILRADSGLEVPFRRGGDWMAFDLDDPRAVKRLDEKRRQFEREKASAYAETDTLPPPLAGAECRVERVKAFHFPGEAYVQNRDLLESLRAACRKAGVAFRREAVEGRWEYAGGLTRLPFPSGAAEARQVLVAAGAWSARVLSEQGIGAPIVPVKGQLLRLAKFHASDSMLHLNDELYLVPRGESLVAGATTEPGNWNEDADGVGEAWVEERLRRWLPGLAVAPLERWSGIRPRTRDRLPWMGWLDPARGWAVCAGHYKTGISMAPLASLCMNRLLQREKPPADLAPFDPWRKQGLARL
jgi:glycine oxidase